MKKNISIIYIILLYALSFQPLVAFSQNKVNHNHSKQLIGRYNKLRSYKSLPFIEHDTILDNIASEISFKNKYRKSENAYNEDSIRSLLCENIIDYKYEFCEIIDNDTVAEFNKLFLDDNSPNLRMGYYKSSNRNFIIKVRSYLKFDHGESYIPRIEIKSNKNPSIKIEIKVATDSIVYYVKRLIPGKYYYHNSNYIPSSSESVSYKERKEARINNKICKGLNNTYPDLILNQNFSDMYLIVTNEQNDIVAIFK